MVLSIVQICVSALLSILLVLDILGYHKTEKAYKILEKNIDKMDKDLFIYWTELKEIKEKLDIK